MTSMGSSSAPGLLHVEQCMGTVFTVDIRGPGTWDAAVAEVVAWLHHVDALFSTYQDDSQISRIRRGELAAERADPLVQEVLALCLQYERETGGLFTAALPGGLDPSGLVKGWAIERASRLLRSRGSHNHAVNGGGDMQLAGEPAAGQPWRVGITDPLDRSRVLTVVTGRDFAVATSGNYERGPHVVDPRTGRAVEPVDSATVVGDALTRVDVYATTAFVLGHRAVPWLETLPRHEGMVVAHGRQHRTAGFGEEFTGVPARD
jgi:thiamine biosynthesis lipoprotein